MATGASPGSDPAFDPGPILPLAEVRAGMRGTGRTVFRAGQVEDFSVEILGVVEGSTPRRSTILAQLGGGPLGETGVIAGMSGSPVWVGGRLIGAVSSAYLFATSPVAGITPIEEMLAVPSHGPEPGEPGPVWRGTAGGTAARLLALERGEWRSPLADAAPARPAEVPGSLLPLAVSGLEPAAFERAARWFRSLGLEPVRAAGVGRNEAGGGGPPGPGEMLAVELVRGDLNLAGFGTVTARDGDRLLAFGHPLFGVGAVDLPVAAAEVVAVLPNLVSSFKIGSLGPRVGALRQDRAAGIYAQLGTRAPTLPVRLGLRRAGREIVDYSFELAVHRLLTPVLVDLALDNAFAAAWKLVGPASLDLAGAIDVAGHEPVQIAQFGSGDQASAVASNLVAAIVAVLLDNEFEGAALRGVTLTAEFREDNRHASIERVWTDRTRVRPGDTVAVRAVLRPARGVPEQVALSLAIPAGAPPGPLELAVGDAGSMARFEARTQRRTPRSLGQLIELLNSLRRSDVLYALATRPDAGVALGGEKLSSLPPSAYALLAGGDGADALLPLRRETLAEAEVRTGWQLSGLRTTKLVVEGSRR